MNSALYKLQNLLEDHTLEFCYCDLIDEIDEEIEKLEDELEDKDCSNCYKFDEFLDRDLLHNDFLQLEARHELKQISDEAYLVAKSILEKYVTI